MKRDLAGLEGEGRMRDRVEWISWDRVEWRRLEETAVKWDCRQEKKIED